MKTSKMSDAVTPSLTRKLFNMALAIGDDVINLTLGDPDICPPKEIQEAACKAIAEGRTRYSANAGLMQAREAYAQFFKNQYGIEVSAADNVMATVGGMEGLFLALASMVDQGDEVIILSPYYVNYYQMIGMCGGTQVVINRLNKTEDELLSSIREACTSKTIAIIVNSPCNPVGDMLSKNVIDGIANIAQEKDIMVISDEVYSSLVYDNLTCESILTRTGMPERTLLIDSCSKRFAMTGYRIGFAVGPKELIANMTKMQENVAACSPLPSQYAAIKAYSGDVDYSYINKVYSHRRDIVYNGLAKIEILKPIYPQATFYCFVNISKTGLSSQEFAYQLLEKEHVAVVPGVAYGADFDNYIRIAFTLSDDVLTKAISRIIKFCESL